MSLNKGTVYKGGVRVRVIAVRAGVEVGGFVKTPTVRIVVDVKVRTASYVSVG